MNVLIRSICLAALVAAGSAWAQQPVDNPDNPHSTKAREKSTTPGSATNQQVDEAEKVNPHHPQSMDQQGQMAGMDHDAMMKNATPQMQLQKLHRTNQHEIEMGKLAEQNGTDRVKSYARTLQRDHQDADKQVMDLARRKNFNLSDAPMNPEKQKQKEMIKNQLASMKGAEFDRAFTNRMAIEHRKVILLAQAWKQDCKDKDVCNLIDAQLPTLQQHLQMAEQLRGPVAQGRAPDNR